MSKPLILNPKFSGFFWTQFFGAFNDNVFKQTIMFMITFHLASVLPKEKSDFFVSIGAGVFVLPFILFSNWSATWADRVGKKKVIVATKILEIAIMALGGLAYFFLDPQNPEPALYFLLGILYLMGTQSAIFGPSKYAIIPEIVEDDKLTEGNGLLEMGTFVAILLGTYLGGWLVDWFADMPYMMALFFIGFAVIGWQASLKIPTTAPVSPKERYVFFFPKQIVAEVIHFGKRRTIFLSILGISFFWFAGAVYLQIIPGYGQFVGANTQQTNFLMIVFSIGIGAGSLLCARLSDEKVEIGLIPFGAIGMTMFSLDFGFFPPESITGWSSLTRVYIDLFGVGLFAGFFIVPLNALLQQRSQPEERSRVMALNNILNAVFMVLSSVYVILLRNYLTLTEPELILILGVLIVAVTAYLCWLLPEFLIRFLLWIWVRSFYRVTVHYREKIPLEGPVLIVANHLSFVDAFLVQMSTHRHIRFIMDPAIYHLPGLIHIFKLMGVIPAYSRLKSPEKYEWSMAMVRETLQRDEIVCIFPEGQISRTGQLFRFRPGMERILKESPVPVVPIFIHGIWGSLLSFSKSRFLWKMPQRFPYPVTLVVGDPLSSLVSAHEARSAVAELGVVAFQKSRKMQLALPNEVLKEAKRHPARVALSDTTGKRIRYDDLYLSAKGISQWIKQQVPDERVGVAMLPSVDGMLINLAIAMAGKVALNCDPRWSHQDTARILDEAAIGSIIVDDELLPHLQGINGKTYIQAKSLLLNSKVGSIHWLERFWFRLLPTSRYLQRELNSESPIAIVYTAGVTGPPKGVLVSHGNINAALTSLTQSLLVDSKSCVCSGIPLSQAYGLIVAGWFPLLLGIRSALVLKSSAAPQGSELLQKEEVTTLLGTPETLRSVADHMQPDQLRHLKHVITGGSPLPQDLLVTLEEKLGLEVYVGYGAAETAALMAINLPSVAGQEGATNGSLGRIVPGMAMKIVDEETGETMPLGESGILWVSGGNIAAGYVNNPDPNPLHNGWFCTGDRVRIDRNGFLFLEETANPSNLLDTSQ